MDAANGAEGAEIEKIINTEIYAGPKSFALLLKILRIVMRIEQTLRYSSVADDGIKVDIFKAVFSKQKLLVSAYFCICLGGFLFS